MLLRQTLRFLLQEDLSEFEVLYGKGKILKGKVSICRFICKCWSYQLAQEPTRILSTIKNCAFALHFCSSESLGVCAVPSIASPRKVTFERLMLV